MPAAQGSKHHCIASLKQVAPRTKKLVRCTTHHMSCLSSITFVSFHHFLLFANPSPSADDPVLAEEPATAFATMFRPQFWWFEIYNMFRRLVLTCAVLLCATLAQTVVFVMFRCAWVHDIACMPSPLCVPLSLYTALC